MADDATNLPAVRSVTMAMAERFGMEPAPFEATVRATCGGKDFTREEFAAFLLVAKEYHLNPLTREIFAFKGKNGAVIPVVSVDGWLRIMNEHPAMDGLDLEDIREGGQLIAVCAKIYRKDRSHAISVTEYLDECRQDKDTWRKWPARMLRHKATIQAARYAFGFAGIYDADEAERILAGNVAPPRGALVDDAAGVATIVEESDDPVAFIEGEAKNLVVNEYISRMRACNSDGELTKVWKKFLRIYYNGTTKSVSRNTFDGLEFIMTQEEERIANQNLDLGRTGEEEMETENDNG